MSKKILQLSILVCFSLAIEGSNSPSQGMTPPTCRELMAN